MNISCCYDKFYAKNVDGSGWKGLKSMIMVESIHGIDSKLDWCLDVTFKKDICRTRAGHAEQYGVITDYNQSQISKQSAPL